MSVKTRKNGKYCQKSRTFAYCWENLPAIELWRSYGISTCGSILQSKFGQINECYVLVQNMDSERTF